MKIRMATFVLKLFSQVTPNKKTFPTFCTDKWNSPGVNFASLLFILKKNSFQRNTFFNRKKKLSKTWNISQYCFLIIQKILRCMFYLIRILVYLFFVYSIPFFPSFLIFIRSFFMCIINYVVLKQDSEQLLK